MYIYYIRNTIPDAIGLAYSASLKVGNGKESRMARIVYLDSVEDDWEVEGDDDWLHGDKGGYDTVITAQHIPYDSWVV